MPRNSILRVVAGIVLTIALLGGGTVSAEGSYSVSGIVLDARPGKACVPFTEAPVTMVTMPEGGGPLRFTNVAADATFTFADFPNGTHALIAEVPSDPNTRAPNVSVAVNGEDITGVVLYFGVYSFSDNTFTFDDCANGGEEPGNGGEEPGNGGEEPGNGGEEPGNGGEEPGNGGEEPGNGGEEPGNGGEEPGNGGEEPGNGGEEPGNGGEEPGNGGEEPGNGGENGDGGSNGSESGSQPDSKPVTSLPKTGVGPDSGSIAIWLATMVSLVMSSGALLVRRQRV